jgi:hypothetical protein
MSDRPKILHVGGTLYWVIRTRDPDTMVLKDADSTPTVAVRKNGASTADSVTVTKRSATTGIYDCSYNPASEVEGDSFTIEESATVTGTTTAQATYTNSWELRVVALERGTDSAALASGVNVTQIAGASVSTSTAQIGVNVVNAGGTAWGSGAITAGAIASNAITSAKLATDCITSAQLASTAITEIQSGLATTANVAAVETDTQDIQSRLPAALVSGRMDSSVGAMASSVLTAAALATDAAEEIADKVWDEPYSQHTTAGSFGKLLDTIRKANLTIDGTVSNAITPTTTTFASDVVAVTSAYAHAVLLFVSGPLEGENSPIISYNSTNGVFVLEEPLTAAPSNGDEFVVIAGSHVHDIASIQSGLATTTQLTTVEGKIDAIDGVTDKLDTTVELDGSVYRFTTNALEQAPSGGGGGSTVIVSPLQAVAPDRVSGTEVMTFINDVSAIGPIAVTDTDGVAVDLSALTLKVCIEKIDGTILANVTPSVSGVDNNQITFTPNADSVAKTGTFRWSLRRTSNNQVYAYGDFVVDAAARIS